MLNVVMLESHYAECRYAECRYAECRYAECRYAECRYTECRITLNLSTLFSFLLSIIKTVSIMVQFIINR
jgi:hypothetical protein